MKITGDHHFAAPPTRAFSALTDPAKLQQAIDVCQLIETTGPDQYDVQVAVNVFGFHVRQTIRLNIRDQQPPHAGTFVLAAASQFGNVHGTVAVKLAANHGGTLLQYAGDVELTGFLASLGPGLIASHARRSLAEFFAKLARAM